MLFKKQKCPHCGRELEATNRTCPYCEGKINSVDRKLVGPGVVSMPFWKQLIYFGIGFVGLVIVEMAMAFIALLCGMDENTQLMFVSFATYFVLFAAIIYFTILNREYFSKQLQKALPYIIGIIAGFVIVGLQQAYSLLLDACGVVYYTNDNEVAVENIIFQSPIASMIFIGIMGPIVEEFTYRLGLFSFMTRINRVLAYVVTILLFSFMHLSIDGLLVGDFNAFLNELINFPAYVISAVVLTVIYDFFGIGASSMAHITNNVFVIIVSVMAMGI